MNSLLTGRNITHTPHFVRLVREKRLFTGIMSSSLERAKKPSQSAPPHFGLGGAFGSSRHRKRLPRQVRAAEPGALINYSGGNYADACTNSLAVLPHNMGNERWEEKGSSGQKRRRTDFKDFSRFQRVDLLLLANSQGDIP